jgi:hypothetical protein
MTTMLQGLGWQPRWVSHLGCIKGCLTYLGMDISDGWLYGATGHAFILNISDTLCPSGPTAWKSEMLFSLAPDIGYTLDGVFAHKSQPDFAAQQRAAWDHVRSALDAGQPCYGWELEIPEYYVLCGYDQAGYHFSGPGCEAVKGSKTWQELGTTDIGMLELYSVRRGQPADDTTVVRQALNLALEFADGPQKWVFPQYHVGLAGYDAWMQALETNTADGFGVAYNAAVWSECRSAAVAFLLEARQRLNGSGDGALSRAIAAYDIVAQNMKCVADTFPFHGLTPEHIQAVARRTSAVTCLRAARAAEAEGLQALADIVAAL